MCSPRKTAIVTGASQGIGAGIVKGFVERGFNVIANSRNAKLAIFVYTHRVRQAIGALTVTLGGIDALIFTAGVGEHAHEIRRRICDALECMGLELDIEANAVCRPDAGAAHVA